jgi:hypothetical protein
MEWIDLALLGDENGLRSALGGLDDRQRAEVIAELMRKLGTDRADVERTMLRLLLERARPYALPPALWSRPVTASNDPRALLRAHFGRIGVAATADRLDKGMEIYLQFSEERRKVPVQQSDLVRCRYRCEHCGLAFCNEELASRSIVSPFGNRGGKKTDALKPHWNGKDDLRWPTMDHDWPVTLYGSNDRSNLKVLCRACNDGKADVLAWEQARSAVGLPKRPQLSPGKVTNELFYTQIKRCPTCVETGESAAAAELTVRLVDANGPLVLDNLVTIVSPGI